MLPAHSIPDSTLKIQRKLLPVCLVVCVCVCSWGWRRKREGSTVGHDVHILKNMNLELVFYKVSLITLIIIDIM